VSESKYRVERGDPQRDRGRILDLWERCGFASGAAASARYDWFYLDNPGGRGRVYLLFQPDGGELVGAVGAGTRLFARGENQPPLRAAILVDFVVHPAHRSMFPALQLQRVAREQELLESEVIYGLPDVKATPVFRRLGSSAQLVSGSHVRVLRSAKFMGRQVPILPASMARILCWFVDRVRLLLPWLICATYGVKARWEGGFTEAFDDFWRRAGRHSDLATGERDRRFLQWRFCRSQQAEWLILSVSNRRGQIEAYFVCRREAEDLQVFDVLLADRTAGAVPLLALSLAAWKLGFESVRVVFCGFRGMKSALLRAGYILRDQRPCFLIQAAGAASSAMPGEWWLTRADEDV
jgi:hypothetical protein